MRMEGPRLDMTPDHLNFDSSTHRLFQSGGAKASTLAEVILNDATGRDASAVRFTFDDGAASWEYETAGEWQAPEEFPAALWPKLTGALLLFAGVEYWQTGACEGVIARKELAAAWKLSTEDRRRRIVLKRFDRLG